jgi:hypothetical protein
MHPSIRVGPVVAALFAGALAGCTSPTEETPRPVARTAEQPLKQIDADLDQASAGVSRSVFRSSPTVVLASADDREARQRAVEVADRLRVPVLVAGDAADDEIERLGADTVLTIGDTDPDEAVSAARRRGVEPAARTRTDTVLVVESAAQHPAAVSDARTAGATVVELASGDPRREPGDLAATTGPIIAVGMPAGFAYTLDVVRHGIEQPSGGYLAVDGRHYTAMYGHPGAPSLGVLGEQGAQASVARVQRLAKKYRAAGAKRVVPAFEIIATVASGSKGSDGDYSTEVPVSRLTPLVDAAEKAGVSVILDLQPGRSDFLEQAKRYRSLLLRPHVGLALDPEWRLRKGQQHLRQIGSVSAAEINRTASWLARLTREHTLPQKLFVVHQFASSMIRGRSSLDTGHPELATVLHVDGSGSQGAKQGTWTTLRQDAPDGLAGWGWKNFVDEDAPMLTARQTWAQVRPHPALITYQ